MKKLLLSLGTAIVVVAPVATVVACGSSTPDKDGEITGRYEGLHVLDSNKEMGVLATGKRSQPLSCWHVQLDNAHLAKSKEIREYMNKSTDDQWHTYGDPILDGINAVRMAISEDLNGDTTLKHMIRDFADNGGAISNPENGWRTDNRKVDPKDTAFKAMAKKQINDWFDKDQSLTIVQDIPGWANIHAADAASAKANPNYNKFQDPERYKLFEEPTAKDDTLEKLNKNYGALTLGTPELLVAQHRVQEVDWLGEFDGHDHGGTMNKIKNNVKEYNNHPTGELSKAPTGDEGFKGENYMFPFTYNDQKFENGADFTSGLLTAINVLYDTDDGSATTGHRTNFYGGKLTSFGWSRTANRNNFQYIITQAAAEDTPRTATADEIKSRPGIQLQLDEPVSTSDFARIKSANPFFNKYSLDALKYFSPMNFLNEFNVQKEFVEKNYKAWMANVHGTAMVAELYKNHDTLEDFNEAMIGIGTYFEFKQPTAFKEYPRFARHQKIGKPDILVKTYDYNGGSTITGEQYGTSPIDKSLFE